MLHINAVKPTLLFVKDGKELLQAVDISIENSGQTVEAGLDARFGSKERHNTIGAVEPGEGTYRVHVPDFREPLSAEFTLSARGEVQDRRKTDWVPKRHWRVCMIPITHHDFGYTDTSEDVLRQYDSFYDDILRFCEETDDWPEESKYRYTVEATWSIQHFVESRPKKITEKLAKYIKKGRIEISALFGNEITALCGHEELIRLMYPSFRLKRKHGAPIRTAAITDIPGFAWGLATVLAGAGVKYFFAGLPEWAEVGEHRFWDASVVLRHGRPDAFRWQGPDGGSVLVYYQGGYGWWSAPWLDPFCYQEVLNELPGMLSVLEERGCPFSVARYAFRCCDNQSPDIRVSHIVREWNSKWAYPELIVATNSMFFEALEKECSDVRVFRGELPGTDNPVGVTSSAQETGINRGTHDRLHSAEKFTTIASLVSDYSYRAARIREAYDNMLLYDEHTWGMLHPIGKAQDWNWSDKSHCAYKAAGLAQSMLSKSVDKIAGLIELKEEGRYIAVFNSLSFQRTDVVRVSPFASEWPFDLVDEETGEKVAYQIVELDSPQAPVPYSAHRYAMGQRDRTELFELLFVAEDVPSLGYKTYRLVPDQQAASFTSSVVVGGRNLENRFFKLTLNPQTGAVESIYDKELEREIVDKEAPHRLNQLIVRSAKSAKERRPRKMKIRKGQGGPVYGSLIVSGQGHGCPQLTQEIILYDEIKRIDIANRVLKDSTPLLEIYFAFPFKMEHPSFRFEGSNSVIEPLADQFPGSNSNYYTVQHWADVTDGEAGVTLSPIESHLLEFGGLWPCYVSQVHHGLTRPDFARDFLKPDKLSKGHMYSYVMESNFHTNFRPVQQGDMLFRYSITTHKGGWKEGRPRDFGWAIGNPLIPVCISGEKEGPFSKSMSFGQVDKPNVLLLTLKAAEDGDGIIARLIETEGLACTVTVTLPFLAIHEAYQTNLVEENDKILSPQKHAVSVPVKAFGISTIRIRTLP